MNKSLRVLVIEDSEDDVLLLMHELRGKGYEPLFKRIETAEDMRTALDLQGWDVIISDYIMPRFSGLAALKLLKKSGLDIPFIIVSGKIGEDIAVEAMKSGAHDYIVKGNLARLIPAIEREIREAAVRSKRRQAEEELQKYRGHLEELVKERTKELEKINKQLQQEISVRKTAEAALLNAVKRAEEEKAKTQAIIAAMGDGISIQGSNFRILYQNQIHKNLMGDHIGEYCYKAYGRKEEICEQCHMVKAFKQRGVQTVERSVPTDIGIAYLEITVSPLTDSSGTIVAGIEIVRNTTGRKRMEDELRDHRDHLDLLVKERTGELREVNKELRAEIMRRIHMEKELMESQRFVQRISDATPNILYLYDVIENQTTYINPLVKEILGYSPEEIRTMGGIFSEAVLHPEDAKVIESFRGRFADAREGDIIETEYRIKKSNGQWRWLYSRNVIFKRTGDGLLKLILGITQDITEWKEAEEELQSSRQQLRNLLAHLQSVREDERTRISREIHDELGQSLTALKMDLSWVTRRLNKDQKHLHEKTQSMSKLIDINIQTVKRISSELRPGLLDDLGLTAALEWQAEEFQGRTGIKCELSIDPEDIALDRDLSTTIFRIFQETLTNIVRHAKAKKVRVSLKKNEKELILQVRDDGRGISEKQITSPKSIGLIGMRERVNYVGGNLKISGSKDKGTTITVGIPIDN